MEKQDKIKELFSEKLGNFEAPVKPGLWEGIASQLPGASVGAVASASMSVFTKGIIGLASAAIIGATAYYISTDTNNVKQDANVVNPISQNGSTSDADKDNGTNSNDLSTEENVNQKTNPDNNSSILAPEIPQMGYDNSKELIRNQKKIVSADENLKNETSPVGVVQQRESVVVLKEEAKQERTINAPIKREANKINTSEELVKKDPTMFQEESIDFSLPNIFTPNGDFVNDEFYIEYKGQLNDFSIVVLDKSNTIVFQTSRPDFKWDGTMMNGEIAPNGNYYYVITAKDASGNPINKYNKLSISR